MGAVRQYVAEGLSVSEAVKRAARDTGAPKNELYRQAVAEMDK